MHTLHFSFSELKDYISWPYFFHAWGVSSQDFQTPEAVQLQSDALDLLDKLSKEGYQAHFRFRLLPAYSREDDIILIEEEEKSTGRPLKSLRVTSCTCPACSFVTPQGIRLPFLRQQKVKEGEPCLCLSDYVRPFERNKVDSVGFFATTVDKQAVIQYESDKYLSLLSQTLCDRLAEAAAEKGHLEVRRYLWGYAPNENLPISELLLGHYQGIRPAIGYPCLPDQSLIFLLAEILDFSSFQITLTETGAMLPHASVSGLMFAHPKAHYFEVGSIGEDQLSNYAHRRQLSVDVLKKYLSVSVF